MRFLIQEGSRPRAVTSYPTAVLRTDNWDDYGFKTMFHARLHLGRDSVLDLETVKILHRDQTGGPTRLPGTSFDSFFYPDYCSLGQSYSYYELLHELGEGVYKPYLEGMCDAVYLPAILAAFKDKDGFTTSLLRLDGAERALEDGAVLFQRGDSEAAPHHTWLCVSLSRRLDDSGIQPGRLRTASQPARSSHRLQRIREDAPPSQPGQTDLRRQIRGGQRLFH
jgi:hypothetical protein